MEKYKLRVPVGEKNYPGQEVRRCTSKEIEEIKEFIEYSVTNRYRLCMKDFCKDYRRQDYVLARSAVVYAVRVRWPIGLVQLGELMNRNHTTLIRIQRKALDYFGDNLTEVSKLLQRWDLLKCQKNTI